MCESLGSSWSSVSTTVPPAGDFTSQNGCKPWAHVETKAEHLWTSICLTPSLYPNWLRPWWTGLMRSSTVQRWDANRTCKHGGVTAKRCECLPLLAVSLHVELKKEENSEASAAWIQNWEKKSHSVEDSIVAGFHLHFQLISCSDWGQSVCVINNMH